MRYDNTSLWRTTALRMGWRCRPLHFLFEIEGKRIAYCYVRKNACSAFKKLMYGLAGLPASDELTPLVRRYRLRRGQDALRADHSIFIHRDPVGRMISLFNNKFVQQRNATDIHADYLRVAGQEPDEATFSDFVQRYLVAQPSDPHTYSQASHLLPIRYTDAIEMHLLESEMAGILGAEVAAKYFRKRTNATEGSVAYVSGGASSMTARELREQWLADRALPTREALLEDRPELEATLRRLYADDSNFLEGRVLDSERRQRKEKVAVETQTSHGSKTLQAGLESF